MDTAQQQKASLCSMDPQGLDALLQDLQQLSSFQTTLQKDLAQMAEVSSKLELTIQNRVNEEVKKCLKNAMHKTKLPTVPAVLDPDSDLSDASKDNDEEADDIAAPIPTFPMPKPLTRNNDC